MNSDPDPQSSPPQPQQHLGRSQLNAAAVDHSENNRRSGPPSGDAATFPSGSDYSRSREKAEKNVSSRRHPVCVFQRANKMH